MWMLQALSLEYIINPGLARLQKDPQVTESPSHKEINTIAYLNVIYLTVMYLNVVKVIAKKHENNNAGSPTLSGRSHRELDTLCVPVGDVLDRNPCGHLWLPVV